MSLTASRRCRILASMPKFRPPAIPIPAIRLPKVNHSLSSFLWAFGLGLYIFLGGMSVGVKPIPILIVSVVSGCAIFLFVRLYGEDDPLR